ncbi:MAG TPA: NADH-quinone oxidoreductase subunit M [Thermoleophilia bacterium]|nr:NADH-quinone oxidoreductase subunit M [Thermoleophilia bacterium]
MLSLTVFFPLAAALLVLTLPAHRPRLVRRFALGASVVELAFALVLLIGFDRGAQALQWHTSLDWIPSLGARYDVAVDGLSLPLMLLTAVLSTVVMIYVLTQHDRPRGHAFLFLLMETGLMGLFSSRDLLLFYVFFEVALVPMYFIVGVWGHERRRYAAMKFFLYTRAASLAMLLSFLALYLHTDPRTFSLDAMALDPPLAGRTAALALLGLVIGFGVKLPLVPLHNWLPDAHVEAPTEGSVMLAGVQLKMGAYGLVAVMLRVLPSAVREYAWLLLIIAIVTLIYGVLAALAQSDLKRLVAYTSVNHMGYVLLGVAIWGLATEPATRQLALNGAVVQMVSHGLLTGGLFFLVGMLQERAQTREMERFKGLFAEMPVFAWLLALFAFGSLGLPGLSGFIAEFQVLGATVAYSVPAAALALLGLIIMTGLFIRLLVSVALGDPHDDLGSLPDVNRREISSVAPLAALSLLIGVLPGLLVALVDTATGTLAGIGL